MTFTLDSLVSSSNGFATQYLSQVYPALAHFMSPLVYSAAVIYVVLWGYRIYSGTAPISPGDIFSRVMTMACVFAALNWGGLAHVIYTFFTGLMEGAASAILGGQSATTIMGALFNQVTTICDGLMKAGMWAIGVVLLGGLLFVVNCVLFLVAAFYMTLATFGLAIVMSLLPIFVATLFWQNTRQWFMNWLGKMVNFSVLYILVIAIVKFGYAAFGTAISDSVNNKNLLDAANVTSADVEALAVIEGVLILFLLQANQWAAALGGGAAMGGLEVVAKLARAFK